MQILDVENIGANHTAVKQGRKVEEEGQSISVLEIFTADHVSGHCRKQKAYCSSGEGDKNRYPVSTDNGHRALEDQCVSGCGKFSWENAITLKPNRLLR